ncbi:lipopolysaccharide biosynthesis protein [Zhouia sp. PK063]|uniref:lipopolysaccharide biosynthesis protein n=1 Tax=Zhouia sp. PK063 TaxID=3373602 RepID=UPI0037A9A55F
MQDKNTQKQAFWFTAINYLGIVIGLVSTVFVYPYDKEFLGIVKYVDAATQIMFPIMVFGGAQALIHFHPQLSEKNQKRLFKYGMVTILAIAMLILIVLIVGNIFISSERYNYLFFAFPMAIALAFVELFKRQATNLQKLAVPTFFERIIPKIALPTIFILLLSGVLGVVSGLIIFVLAYFLLLLLLGFYLFKIYKVDFNLDFKPLFDSISKKEYYGYSFFSFIGSLGSFLAFRIDALMIPNFLSFEDNGTYNIGLNLASAIAVPATGMFAIYAPLISKFIKTDDMQALGKKYIEIATVLLLIGALFYSSVILGIDDFFHLMPTYEKLAGSIPVIMILGVNVVINMATGFNNEIISYSKYFKFNIISVAVLAVLNILLNLYFLINTNLGMLGVAYASLIAMIIFNGFKLIFIYQKFHLVPFDRNYFKLLCIVLLVSFGVYLIPSTSNYLFDFVIKVGLNIAISVFLIYKLKLVFMLNYWVNKLLKIKLDKQ